MNPVHLSTLVLYCAMLLACQPKPDSSSRTDSTDVTENKGTVNGSNDFLIVPGERVGPVTATTSEADLIKRLGSSVVTAGDTLYGPEGDTFLGTVLYKGTPDEVQITFYDQKRTQPEAITIRPQLLDDEGNPIKNLAPSRWTTADGLRIGTTLKALEKRNGKPFKLWGFGWDYGGALSDWQGGKMARLTNNRSTLSLSLGPPLTRTPAQEKAYNKLLGDGEFLSSSADMQLLNPIVEVIRVEFSR